jgi:hypothetical protein
MIMAGMPFAQQINDILFDGITGKCSSDVRWDDAYRYAGVVCLVFSNDDGAGWSV